MIGPDKELLSSIARRPRPTCHAARVTLTQLEAFVLVARLGSVKAAAHALGVSEPAVSGALATLRQHLGDPLISKTTTGMTLSPGGQRLIGIASRMINLAAEAEAVVRQEAGAPDRLRVVATSTVAEFVAPPLFEAMAQRGGAVNSTVGVVTTSEMAALLLERLADVAIGPQLIGESAEGLVSEPMFRYRLQVVASPAHRLARATKLTFRQLADEHWMVDPGGIDASTGPGRVIARLGVPDRRVSVFPSDVAARAAVAEGQGIGLAVMHLVQHEVDRGRLVPLPVEGTPIEMLWYVSMLAGARRVPAAVAFGRFLTTPEALQAMHRSDGGVPPSRFRPPVYVTIWN